MVVWQEKEPEHPQSIQEIGNMSSEAQLVFTVIATKDGFTVSGKSALRGRVEKHDVAAYATSDGDLALVMI